MKRISLYSLLLLGGMAVAQTVSLDSWNPGIQALTLVCLSYIMLEVGLEFSADAGHLGQYAMDFAVAAAAAVLPWLGAVVYFNTVLGTPLKSACLVGLFAAATSAGVLFTMLAAAGLEKTWVYQKARILAVFDDLVTLLLLVPLQILFIGLHWQLAATLIISIALVVIGWRWLNRILWPVTRIYLLGYAAVIAGLSSLGEHTLKLHLSVLLPAFIWGCLLKHRAGHGEGDDPRSLLDQGVKALFMFLVGCSLPRMAVTMNAGSLVVHVIMLTVILNLGKCVPMLFYRQKTVLKDRVALSLAMFPRGEVGAGILLISLSYGITDISVAVGCLSLALNLLMTGFFIQGVARLTKAEAGRR